MAKHNINKYLRGTYEELDIIDEDMKQLVGQSLKDYIWERVIKPWVEQSPNIPNDFLELPHYIVRNKKRYWIRKWRPDVILNYGIYDTLDDAGHVVEYLQYKKWPASLSTNNTKMKGTTYTEFLKRTILEDEDYQTYMKNKSE